MAAVKSLINSPKPYCYDHCEQKMPLDRSHSFSGQSLGFPTNSWFSKKSFTSLFDSTKRKLGSVYMLQLSTPTTTSSSVFDCYSPCSLDSLEDLLATGFITDSLINKDIIMPPGNSNSTMLVSLEIMPALQGSIADEAVSSASLCHTAPDKGEILCSTQNCNDLSDSDENMQNNSICTDKIKPPTQSSDCDISGNIQQHSDGFNKQGNNNIQSSVDVSTTDCNLKSKCHLAQILSAPRKLVRKGRPSSRKQKKRNREKCKREKNVHEPSTLQTEQMSNKPIVHCDITYHPKNLETEIIYSHKLDDSPKMPSPESKIKCSKKSDQVNSTSKLCQMTQFLFRLKSCSEEVEDDEDYVDGCDGWSQNEQNTICFSPKDSYGFNFALNLDSIFQNKKVSTIDLCANKNQILALDTKKKDYQNLKSCIFNSGNIDDSDVEFCESPSVDFADKEFICQPPIGIVSQTKHSSVDLTSTILLDSTISVIDDQSSTNDFQTWDQDIDLEKINSQWNEYYTSAGFRNCFPEHDVINDASIKVHFAVESDLLTVFILEEEEDERGCPWQQFAVDRERFERRILELETVISPVLEANHRSKILKHRLSQNK